MNNTTSEYLASLQQDKADLVEILNEKGVEASDEETFTSLVPKVGEISGGDPSEFFNDTIIPSQRETSTLKSSVNLVGWTQLSKKCPYKEITIDGSSSKDSSFSFAGFFMNCPWEELPKVNWINPSGNNMNSMFYNCYNIKELPNLDFINVGLLGTQQDDNIFSYCKSLENVIWPQGVYGLFGKDLFSYCSKLKTLNLANMIERGDGYKSFYQICKENRELTSVIMPKFSIGDLYNSFYNCKKLEKIDFTGCKFNPNGISLNKCFYYCQSLKEIVLDEPIVATSVEGLFYHCENIEKIDFSLFDVSKVTYFGDLFSNCTSLKELNLGDIDTRKGTYFRTMFDGLRSLPELDLTKCPNFVTNLATNLSFMFSFLTSVKELNLPMITNEKVTSYSNMEYMFDGCSSLTHLDIRGLVMSKYSSYPTYFIRGVPTTCEIIVKDDAEKQWFNAKVPSYTNVKTAAEYDAEQA